MSDGAEGRAFKKDNVSSGEVVVVGGIAGCKVNEHWAIGEL